MEITHKCYIIIIILEIVLRMDYQFSTRSFYFLLFVEDMFLQTLTNFHGSFKNQAIIKKEIIFWMNQWINKWVCKYK